MNLMEIGLTGYRGIYGRANIGVRKRNLKISGVNLWTTWRITGGYEMK